MSDRQISVDLNAHPLFSTWSLWYHDKDNNDWSINGYQHIVDISSVEEFWMTYNRIPDFTSGMFFLMRGKNLPIWETFQEPIHFIKYKAEKRTFYKLWFDICKLLIGETITDNPSRMVGVSLSPKFRNMIIKIWTHETSLVPIRGEFDPSIGDPVFISGSGGGGGEPAHEQPTTTQLVS